MGSCFTCCAFNDNNQKNHKDKFDKCKESIKEKVKKAKKQKRITHNNNKAINYHPMYNSDINNENDSSSENAAPVIK